jgi:hypothetical protein
MAKAVLSGAAVAMAVAVGSFAATTPDSISTTPVDLSALIIGASSTNPAGEGVEDFYGGLFQEGQDTTVIANFFTGPPGIYRAIYDNRNDDNNIVLASGWGAANTSLLLTYLAATGSNDPVLTDPKLYVLDNNVASPNGGFGTRLPVFALIGVNPLPTPTDPGVPVVNVVYEYDINSNIPAYLWNAPAMANSLLAYFERRLNQESLDFPLNADGTVREDLCDTVCTDDLENGETVEFTLANGEVTRVKIVDDTTYVSYESNQLPLVAPLRRFGEPGNRLADAATPALRAVVDYGYPDNDPLAAPEQYIPARVIPRPAETRRFVNDFADGVQQGVEMLRDDSSSTVSTRQVTPKAPVVKKKPLSSLKESLNFTPRPVRGEGGSPSHRQGRPLVRTTVETVGQITERLQHGPADGASPPASEPAAEG